MSTLKQAYIRPLPVSEAKKKDLMKLCQKGVICEKFHAFYEQLCTASNIVDTLPEPDVTEETELSPDD